MQPRLRVDSFFHGQVCRAAILWNSGVSFEIRTLATGLLPSFTTEWVGAVASEGPHVVQGKDERNLPGEHWQLAEVKIATKKIVCMYDLRTRVDQIGQASGCRLMEILSSIDFFQRADRFAPGKQQAE